MAPNPTGSKNDIIIYLGKRFIELTKINKLDC